MRSRTAFTLIELLVVISIIGLLVALLLPGVALVRDSARSTICSGNLRQLGLAFSSYESDWGLLPYAWNRNDVWSPNWDNTTWDDLLYMQLNEEVAYNPLAAPTGIAFEQLSCPFNRNSPYQNVQPRSYFYNVGWTPNGGRPFSRAAANFGTLKGAGVPILIDGANNRIGAPYDYPNGNANTSMGFGGGSANAGHGPYDIASPHPRGVSNALFFDFHVESITWKAWTGTNWGYRLWWKAWK